jgi:CO/xanthine dehydrogenase Mo-binding subunit
METGGGFGGKEEYPSMIAGHAALLAWKSGRPVKMIYDRAEDMAATTKRHPSRRAPHGRHARRPLLAMDIDFVIDGGAYCTLSPVVLSRGTIHAAGPYAARTCACAAARSRPTRRRTARSAASARRRASSRSSGTWTRSPPRSASRPTSSAAATSSRRARRARRAGRSRAGRHARAARSRASSCPTITRSASASRARTRARGRSRRASASRRSCTAPASPAPASAPAIGRRRRGDADGRVRVLAASTEIGQGTNTIFSQIAADALGIDCDDVEVVAARHANVPNSGPTVASRTCMVVGKLVETAALGAEAHADRRGYLPGVYTRAPSSVAPARVRRAFGSLRDQRSTSRRRADVGRREVPRRRVRHLRVGRLRRRSVGRHDDVRDARRRLRRGAGGRARDQPRAGGRPDRGRRGAGHRLGALRGRRLARRADGQRADDQLHHADVDGPAADPRLLLRVPYAYGPGGAKGIGELPMDGPAPAILNASRTRPASTSTTAADARSADGRSMEPRWLTRETARDLHGQRPSRTVNARARHPMARLLDVLREELG